METNQTPAPPRGRPRRLLVDRKYRRQMFVFATHPELFTVTDVARFQGVNRDTASADIRDVLTLDPSTVLK